MNINIDSLPIIPGRGLVTSECTQMRWSYLNAIGINTHHLKETKLSLREIQNNIESFIGTTEIPLGIVGPLIFNNGDKQEFTYCAGGTLEGALIASMNRGAKAISQSGGFSAKIFWQKMSRAPMFLFESEEEAEVFKNFSEQKFDQIKSVVEQYSNHAKLIELRCIRIEKTVHLKFVYSTGDASGQNMTTTCTWHGMLFIAERLKKEKNIIPIDFIIEGNGSSDKKVSTYSMNAGRGISVMAECFLDETVINKVLRTTSEKIVRCFEPSKAIAGMDGMVGYNINVANAIAAIFVATGQDLASIHESGIGVLDVKKTNEGLKLSLHLPNLVIGTVGGGTHLPKQAQALEIMKCNGTGKAERFAKLIAGFALSLEISTYAAIVSGEFAKAHEKLGRNKPANWLLRSEITEAFLLDSIKEYINKEQIVSITPSEKGIFENGILTAITTRISKKIIGFVPLLLQLKQGDKTKETKLLLKSKALDSEVIKGLHLMAASIHPELSDLIYQSREALEYKNCHIKEIEIYKALQQQEYKSMPLYFGHRVDAEREIYLFLQEALDRSEMQLMDSENFPNRWHAEPIKAVIKSAVTFHKIFENKAWQNVTPFKPWESVLLYSKLIDILIEEEEDPLMLQQLHKMYDFIAEIEQEASGLNLRKTLVHNDFNPRNIAIRNNGEPAIYDWELGMLNIPHRDIVEFLSFVLPADFKKETLFEYLEYHYQFYSNEVSRESWMKGYSYSIKEYLVTRVSFYEAAGILMKFDFSKRVLTTCFRMLHFLENND